MYNYLVLFLSLILFYSCTENQEEKLETNKESIINDSVIIEEKYLTLFNENENIDSPAFWQGEGGENWLIATSKSKHLLAVYDASTGKRINSIGSQGKAKGQFLRPNGIWVIDNLLLVVERDNKRIQVLTLPGFNSLGFIAENQLIKPYGIYVYKTGEEYKLYVTDQYGTTGDSIPPDSLLGERVHLYTFNVKDNKLDSKLVKKFGDRSGDGVLKTVESVYADPENDNLLIAEELETDTYVKVYTMDGKFKNKVIGKGLFKFQAEGITLLECNNGKGYWICTDQSKENNRFFVFDRITLEKVAYFILPKTTNTDGVWLTQKAFQGFSEEAFFAVNNDGGVNATDIRDIIEKCKLNCK